MRAAHLAIALCTAGLIGSCTREPEITPPEPTLRRLTVEQYHNSLRDLLGEDVVLPSQVEPDTVSEGLVAIGSSVTTISPRGLEQYEYAAYNLADQVLLDPDIRSDLVPCSTADDDCNRQFIESFGKRAWRRPLTSDEVDTLAGLASSGKAAMGDHWEGLTYAMAAILMSPNFLYRVELGSPGDEGVYVFDDYELATRLSYFLWNTTPDDTLLEAAAAGELTDDKLLEEHVRRMVDDERSREGLRAFVSDWLELHDLDELSKDPTLFTHMSPEVGPDAREETLGFFEHHVFDAQTDYRNFFIERTTWVNPRLSAMYDVPAPDLEGFALTQLPEDGTRRGLLGQISVLAGNSHPVSTSATLRGKFIRERLLCELIPPPPADLNTSIPEPSPDAPTLRERVNKHQEVPLCASCHQLTDDIGLGLENFDGIGMWRVEENYATIDPSGSLDGADFADAWELGRILRDDERPPACAVEMMYEYAVGHAETPGETPGVARLVEDFGRRHHYRLKELLVDVATSPGFRQASPIDTSAEPDDGSDDTEAK